MLLNSLPVFQKHLQRAQGYVFDLDGTLVDTCLDFSRLRKLLGLAEDADILAAVATMANPEDQKNALGVIEDFERQGITNAKVYSGVRDVLLTLQSQRTPFGIFTRNSYANTMATLERFQLPACPVFAREQGPAKPDPTGLHYFCRQWSLEPHKILYFGDYLYDLQAGKNAGVPTALFWPDSNQTPDFDISSAAFVFSSWDSFLNGKAP